WRSSALRFHRLHRQNPTQRQPPQRRLPEKIAGTATPQRKMFKPLQVTPPAPITRPLVGNRFIATPKASTTRPLVFKRSTPTPAASTQPTVSAPLSLTPKASATRLLVIKRSCRTPAAAISHWAIVPASISRLAIAIFISAALVFQPKKTPSASAAIRQQPLSKASARPP